MRPRVLGVNSQRIKNQHDMGMLCAAVSVIYKQIANTVFFFNVLLVNPIVFFLSNSVLLLFFK